MGALLVVTMWALIATVLATWVLWERACDAVEDEYELVRRWEAAKKELPQLVDPHGDGKVADG